MLETNLQIYGTGTWKTWRRPIMSNNISSGGNLPHAHFEGRAVHIHHLVQQMMDAVDNFQHLF